jgi:HAD superfamily hydrolase (TIGR01509 family)
MHYGYYDGIGIDFDGTLVDSDKAHTEARLRAYEQLAVDLDEPRLASVDPTIHAEGHHHGSTSHDINAWIIEQAGVKVEGVDIATEVVARKKENYREIAANGLEARPGAVEFLMASLRRWQDNALIVTTAHLNEVEPFLEVNGLTSSFSRGQLITAEDVTRPKPNPEAYEKALKRTGLNAEPSRLLVVEDTPQGIEAANRAGATVVGLLTPEYRHKLLKQKGAGQPEAFAEGLPELQETLKLP